MTVMKLGGSLLAHPAHLDAVLGAVDEARVERPLLIVPGGGRFADVVRDVDRRIGLSDQAAHWMAVLAMDQYAHLVASRMSCATIVIDPNEIGPALAAKRVPVLAPSSWLRKVDPLPHSWDVTSDSIAAWVAGCVGATRLILVKAPGAPADGLDRHFARALPEQVTPLLVPADRLDTLRAALRG